VYRRVLAPSAIAVGFYIEVEAKDEESEPQIRKRSSVSFHPFRHTCASLLFDAGRNIKQVQEWLGHADPDFSISTYVHLMDEGVGDAAFMDAAIQLAPVPPSLPERSLEVSVRYAPQMDVREFLVATGLGSVYRDSPERA
jgi:Phage integrase family